MLMNFDEFFGKVGCTTSNSLLHCALSLAAQCIVIGPVCVQRAGGRVLCVCGFMGLIPR